MSRLILICLSLCTFLPFVQAQEGPIEFLNRKASQMISGDDCSQGSAGAQQEDNCSRIGSQKSTDSLGLISEKVYYNELAALELERLQCAVNKTKSLANQEPVTKKSLDRLNETLPYLNAIRQEIRTLTNESQLLRGKIGSFENTNPAMKISPEKQKRIDEYNEGNELLKKKMIEYERRMAEIPGSEIPEVRAMIEERMAGAFSKLTLFTAADQKKLSDIAIARMQDSIKVLQNSKSAGGDYSLDRNLKVRLAKDQELAASLMAKFPALTADIHRFQCHADQRDKGGDLLSIGTLVVPAGGWGLAKLARMRSVLAIPVVAKTAAQGSKVLSYSAMAVGTGVAFQELVDKCLRSDAGFTNNKCEVTLKSLAAEHSQFDCLSSVVLNSAGGAGGIIGASKGKEAKAVSDFIEKNKVSVRARDLDAAGGLDNSQRIDATQALLGRNLNETQRRALIEAHEVGAGFGKYTQADIDKKREILRQADFSMYETETLLWKGVAGKAPENRKEEWLKLKDSSQKFRLLAEDAMASSNGKATPEAVEYQRKSLVLRNREFDSFVKDVEDRKIMLATEPRDFWELSNSAAMYGAMAKDADEKEYAKALVIKAFQQEVPYLIKGGTRYTDSFGRTKDDAVSNYIDNLKAQKNQGQGIYKEATRFQIEALEDYYRNMDKWDNGKRPYPKPSSMTEIATPKKP